MYEGDFKLFADKEDLAAFMRRRTQQWEADVKYASDEDLGDPEFAATTVEKFRLQPVSLRREEASFGTFEEHSARIHTTVTMPAAGNLHLLRVFDAAGPQMYARLHDSQDPATGRGGAWVRLRADFPSAVTSGEIRKWASESADAIESALKRQEAAVLKFNEQLTLKVHQMVDAKKDAGSGAARLAAELSEDGI